LIEKERLIAAVMELHRRASIVLPPSVKRALQESYAEENELSAQYQLETVLKNIAIAEKERIPVCQDTGVPIFFIRIGADLPTVRRLAEAIPEGTARATKSIPLRENVIHPLTKKNSGTNTGWRMPFIYYDLGNEAFTEVTLLLKGYGSEAKTSLAYIPTSEDLGKGITKFVLDCVRKALGEPCPPYVIGIGLGGSSDIAAYLAKKAFLRLPLGRPHPDPDVAGLERKLFQVINSTGIGAMGMGGQRTALAVHVELCGTHSAAVPVVVAFQCWADRQASMRIHPDGNIQFVEEP
jgi:fumarate hydratase subunit alpha